MVKKIGFKCDKCNYILHKQGKCECGNLGIIPVSDNMFRVYNDNFYFSIIDLYFDSTNTLKYIQNNYIKEKGKVVFFDKKHLDNFNKKGVS